MTTKRAMKMDKLRIVADGTTNKIDITIDGEIVPGVTMVAMEPNYPDDVVTVTLSFVWHYIDVCPGKINLPDGQLEVLARLAGYDLVKRMESEAVKGNGK